MDVKFVEIKMLISGLIGLMLGLTIVAIGMLYAIDQVGCMR